MTFQNKKNQLEYISLAQIVGCILVVFGHSYPFVTEIPKCVESIRQIIYSFHMPLFVFCSGFLFSYSRQVERRTFGKYISQRAKKLLLPYIVLSLIGILPKYLLSPVLNDSLQLNPTSLIRAFVVPRENIWGHFWFLPMIFFMGVIAYLLDKYVLNKGNGLIGWSLITASLMLISIHYHPIDVLQVCGINDLIKYGWSYALGILISRIFGDIKAYVSLSSIGILLLTLVSLMLLFILFPYIGYAYVKLIFAIILITLILFICANLDGRISIRKEAPFRQTYQIFILSWPCQLVAEILLERVLHLQWWVILLIVFITGVTAPIMIIKLIEKIEDKTNTHYLSLILGK